MVIIPLPLRRVAEVVSTELPRVMLVFVVAMVPARFNWELLVAVRPPAKVRVSEVLSPKVIIPVFVNEVAPLTLPPDKSLRLKPALAVLKVVAFKAPLKVTSLPEVDPLILTDPTVTGLLKVAPPLLVMVIPPDIKIVLFEVIVPEVPESKISKPLPTTEPAVDVRVILPPVGKLLLLPVEKILPPLIPI
jgi:hypothetical protein